MVHQDHADQPAPPASLEDVFRWLLPDGFRFARHGNAAVDALAAPAVAVWGWAGQRTLEARLAAATSAVRRCFPDAAPATTRQGLGQALAACGDELVARLAANITRRLRTLTGCWTHSEGLNRPLHQDFFAPPNIVTSVGRHPGQNFGRTTMLRSLFAILLAASMAAAKPTTFDGKHDITTVNLTVVYFVPKDRTPLADWKDRVEYYTKRIAAFHARELDGISTIKPAIHPVPLVSEQATAHFRRGDQNRTFFDTMDDVKALLKWKPDRTNGFPVLLVLSDMNWRELDDFTRLRMVNGKPVHEGNIAGNGRHFPGAESGGARATYIANPGYGMGLVSGDGWRVPYAGGSDCVVYHEGLGHSLGLPHPEPIDDSVMGVAQYKFWINEAKLNHSQKLKFGWTPPEQAKDRSTDLFTHFTALQSPVVPKAGSDVALSLKWPKDAAVKSFTIRTQTAITAKWVAVKSDVKGKPPASVPLGQFEKPGPLSYRVDVELKDGQKSEIWGYFQVK